MKTKEEILKAETAHEVLEWLKALPREQVDEEVCQHFNVLAAKEFEERIGPDFDPEMHYDFLTPKKRESYD